MTTTQYNALLKSGSDDFRKLNAKAAEKKYGKPRPRLENGMNKQEAKYADRLARMKIAGEIHCYGFIGNDRTHALRISERRRYKPDFYVCISPTEPWEFHEVKGYLRDGGSIRFDLAAEKYPGHVFRMVRFVKGEWVEIRTLNNRKDGN